MISKEFTVRCWNATHFPETKQAMVGQCYTATIEESYRVGTNGFVIQELDMVVVPLERHYNTSLLLN